MTNDSQPAGAVAAARAEFRPCVIVPVFDHAATVGGVVRGAALHAPIVIVVDDGSRDGSGDAARRGAAEASAPARVEVLVHAVNSGKGAALLTGLRRAAELGCTHAVTIDADGQHRPDDIPGLLAAARTEPSAVVVGARDLDQPDVPASSRFGRDVSNFWVLRTTGADLPDTQSGFRCYPVAPVLALPLRCRSYDFEVEVLVRAAWAGCALRAAPIRVHYPERALRISHFRAFRDNVRISWTYTRLAARRVLPTRATWRAARRSDRPRVRLRDAMQVVRDLGRQGRRPVELGLAVATGVFIGASPLWGIHGALAVYLCVRLHLNVVAAFLGSNVSLPFIAPYLIFASVQTGHRLLRGEFLDLDPRSLRPEDVPQYLADYAVGSVPIATVLAVVTGLATFCVAWLLRRRGRTP